jgi:hypothetical protein
MQRGQARGFPASPERIAGDQPWLHYARKVDRFSIHPFGFEKQAASPRSGIDVKGIWKGRRPMKRVVRPVLLCVAVTFMILVLTKYLLSDGSPMSGLPASFIDWCLATYNPQNAEEVADMEMVIALAISTVLTSVLACAVLLLRKKRGMGKT